MLLVTEEYPYQLLLVHLLYDYHLSEDFVLFLSPIFVGMPLKIPLV